MRTLTTADLEIEQHTGFTVLISTTNTLFWRSTEYSLYTPRETGWLIKKGRGPGDDQWGVGGHHYTIHYTG